MSCAELSALPLPERYIVSSCHQLVMRVTQALEAHSFGDAGRMIYEFLWDEFADWYIEASKARMRTSSSSSASSKSSSSSSSKDDNSNNSSRNGDGSNSSSSSPDDNLGNAGMVPGEEAGADGSAEAQQRTRRVLTYVFDTCMRLLHPYMPFLTEALWQALPHHGESLMVAPWPLPYHPEGAAGPDGAGGQGGEGEPQSLPVDTAAVATFGSVQALVRAVRNARAQYGVDPGRKITVLLRVEAEAGASPAAAEAVAALRATLQTERAMVALLARADEAALQLLPEGQRRPAEGEGDCVHLVVEEGLEAFLPQAGMVDAEKERQRLGKQAQRLGKDVEVLRQRLASKGFVERAPPQLVEEVRGKLRDAEEQLRAIDASLLSLG